MPPSSTPTAVFLRNDGDTPFKDQYDSQRYVIDAGETIMVPYDALCLWLGHPQSSNVDPRNRVRLQEYERIRVRYGVDARALEMAGRGDPIDADELFKTMRPSLVALDPNQNVIIAVADDPEGTTLNPVDDLASNADIQAQLLARLQQLEQEQRVLKDQLAQKNRAERALDDAAPIPEDANPAGPSSSIFVGTVEEAPKESKEPRRPGRSTPGEDAPSRIRVTSP